MPKVVITGIAGFIGCSLARECVARGYEVFGVDNLSTGKRDNIADLLHTIDFREGELGDRELLRSVCSGADVIFHQAALPSVAKSVLDPLKSHIANIDGTLNLLLVARELGVRRIVYAASSSAYGDSETLPKQESMPTAPISPYAVQKLTGEHYMQSFTRVYGLETVCLRYFNVFGQRQGADSPYSGVLAKFITTMLAGERPVIYGDGTQSRDFTYIENVVQANMLAGWAVPERVSGKVYNIACGERHSLSEVYELLAGALQFDGPPEYAPARTGDIQHSLADISRARADLGYQPHVSFAEGFDRTIDWYRRSGQDTARQQRDGNVRCVPAIIE